MENEALLPLRACILQRLCTISLPVVAVDALPLLDSLSTYQLLKRASHSLLQDHLVGKHRPISSHGSQQVCASQTSFQSIAKELLVRTLEGFSESDHPLQLEFVFCLPGEALGWHSCLILMVDCCSRHL